MKSLLVSSEYFPPQVGGISQMMARIAAALGPERMCCLTGVEATPGSDESAIGVPVYRRPRVFRGSRASQGLHLAVALGAILPRERPRAVQIATAYDGSLGLLLRRLLGLPYLVYAHGNEVLHAMEPDFWPKPRLALQRADCVVANSRFTAQLLERAGVEASRIELVHPGCDTDRFRPLEPDPEMSALLRGRSAGPVILTVGNLVARKGHDRVIRALPRVAERLPDVTYLIVGDGPHRPTLEAEAAAAGVGDRVVFAGRLAAEDLPAAYSLGDVFAMPSRQDLAQHDVEGFGIVFVEANACGLPVLAGRSGGVVDAVVEGETGLLVDPLDVEQIAAGLVRLLEDPERARRMGERGRARAIRDFTWSRVARDVDAAVRAIVERRSSRAGGG